MGEVKIFFTASCLIIRVLLSWGGEYVLHGEFADRQVILSGGGEHVLYASWPDVEGHVEWTASWMSLCQVACGQPEGEARL